MTAIAFFVTVTAEENEADFWQAGVAINKKNKKVDNCIANVPHNGYNFFGGFDL